MDILYKIIGKKFNSLSKFTIDYNQKFLWCYGDFKTLKCRLSYCILGVLIFVIKLTTLILNIQMHLNISQLIIVTLIFITTYN